MLSFYLLKRTKAITNLLILVLAFALFSAGCAGEKYTGPNPSQSSSEGSGPSQSNARPPWINQQRIFDESQYGQWLKADLLKFYDERQKQANAKLDKIKALKQLAEQSLVAKQDLKKEIDDHEVMRVKLQAEADDRKAAVTRSFASEMDRAIAQVVRQGFKNEDPNLLVIQTLDRQIKTSVSSHSLNYNTFVAPFSGGSGSLNRDTIEKYDSVAVLDFKDAPGSPNSGQAVATTLTNMMATGNVFTVLERSRVEQIYEEQRLQLLRGDERLNTLNVGKMLGAKAVVVGEVNQYESKEQGSSVSISLRIVDVESGSIVYSGTGQWPEPIRDPPQIATTKLLACLLVKLGDHVGFGRGYIGASMDYRTEDGRPIIFVKNNSTGLPC
jgi:curli biogenesis system outer membrane secretion channel CsgG